MSALCPTMEPLQTLQQREGVKERGREEERQVDSTQGVWKERHDMGYVGEKAEVFIHSTQMGGSIQRMMDI